MIFSPITLKRWQKFKANRRSYYSLIFLISLLIVSPFIELIANDTPLIVTFQGKIFFPTLEFVADSQLGGELPITCQFKDENVKKRILNSGGWMVWPLIPHSYNSVDRYSYEAAPSAPSTRHLLGTDDQGRDVLARLLYGLRLSCLFGIILAAISIVIASTIGAIQGYFGGRVDLYIQRLSEIWSGLPVMYLIVLLSSVITPGFWGILLIMSLFSWTGLANLVRAEFLRTRNLEYVRAAELLGVPSP
jgi:microcin C transport system permease protein